MSEIKNTELFEIKKEAFKEYIKNNSLPNKDIKLYFEDGKSMSSFFYTNRKKLLQDKEIQEIIEEKRKEEEKKFIIAEEKLKNQEQAFLNLLDKKPKSFNNLNEIEKLIFYRECFLTTIEENQETYVVQNIDLNKMQILTFKELYYNCYATYLEKEKEKGNNPITEKLDKKELEKLDYLNTLCIQTNWNKNKINDIAKAYNCTSEDIKDLVIKYNYLKLYPEITGIGEIKKQCTATEFQKHQLISTTEEEISNTYNPIQIKEYMNYKKSTGYGWKYLKNIKGFPTDEIIKIIYNIQTKSNIFKKNHEKKKAEKRAILVEKQNTEKIETATKEGEKILTLLKNQEFSTTTEFCKNNDIKYNQLKNIITTLKESNVKLATEIEEILQNKPNQKVEANEEIKNLLNALKEYEKKKKEFTIIDYQQLTNISMLELKKALNNLELSNEDKKIIQTFISPIIRSAPLKVKEVMSITNTLKKKNGELVNISIDEIKKIINYMEQNKIPIVTKAYYSLLKLYINGELELELEKTKNRKI